MADFVQYHKREKMGYPAIDVDNLAVYTSKTGVKKGDRVWLIAGEGTPRNYYLRATFRVSNIGSSDSPNFKFRVSGKDGQLLDPMPKLNAEPWFWNFLESQGNFAFGLNQIIEKEEVEGLSGILHAHSFR